MQHVPSSYIHARFPPLLVSFVSFGFFDCRWGFSSFLWLLTSFEVVFIRFCVHSSFFSSLSFLPFSITSILSPATTNPPGYASSRNHHRQFLHIITHTRHFIICICFYEQHCNGYKSLYRSCIGVYTVETTITPVIDFRGAPSQKSPRNAEKK